MRIAVDIREFSDRPAGIGNYCGHLASALAASNPGEELLMVGHDKLSPTVPDTDYKMILVHDRWKAGYLRSWWENVHLPLILHTKRVDLFHATSHIVPPSILGGRMVVTIHDMTNFLHPEWYQPRNNRYRKWMISRGIQNADAVIAVSKQTAKDIIRFFPDAEAKTKDIYEGINPGFSPTPDPDAIPENLKDTLSSPFILFTGTISPRKNVDTLIEAFASFLNIPGCSEYRLVLAGKRGWYDEAVLRKPKELNIENQVIRIEYPDTRTLAELYRKAALFCCLSLYEGFGLPVLEAMASGTPVLVSDRGSLPELVVCKDCMTELENAGKIAERMAKIIFDRQLRNKITEDGLTKSKEFSWHKCALETWKTYKTVFSS